MNSVLKACSPVPGPDRVADTHQMLGELSLGTTTLATGRATECPQTGVQLNVSHTVLLEGIWPLECFTTVVTQVRALVVVNVVDVADIVLLASCLI